MFINTANLLWSFNIKKKKDDNGNLIELDTMGKSHSFRAILNLRLIYFYTSLQPLKTRPTQGLSHLK
jgi:hypothetical protein